MPAERGRYEPLESISIQKHESESACDDDLDLANMPASKQPMWTRKQATMAFAANIVILLVSLCVLLISFGKKPALSDLECAKKVSTYCEYLSLFSRFHLPCLGHTLLTFVFSSTCLGCSTILGRVVQ